MHGKAFKKILYSVHRPKNTLLFSLSITEVSTKSLKAENYFSGIRIDLFFCCRTWINPTRLQEGMAFQALDGRMVSGRWHTFGLLSKPHKFPVEI